MSQTAIIAGVGPGLGEALARRFAREKCAVGLFARSDGYLSELAAEIGEQALAVPTDVTDPAAVRTGVEEVRDAFGPIDVLIHNASGGGWSGLAETEPEAFERAWRVGPFGGLLCTQAVLPDMQQSGGTIILTGATSAVRGRGGALGFSMAKFGVRGMAESLARELGPDGIHVAHVVIDGQIATDPNGSAGQPSKLDPDAIADAYWHLVQQDQSAWTLELDLRPQLETF